MNINNKEWTNITVVRDAENLVNQLYINGELDSYIAFDNLNFTNTTEDIFFAQSNCLPIQHSNLRGSLDDILFYNRALSGSEVATIQNLATISNVPEPSVTLLLCFGILFTLFGLSKFRSKTENC